jgi:hypothetical protein
MFSHPNGFFRPFLRLLLLPGYDLRLRVLSHRISKNVGMTPDHFVADGADNIIEGESSSFLRHTAVKYDLKQKIAQFILKVVKVATLNSVCHLVRFLNGVRKDCVERLLEIPGTSVIGIAQTRHDGNQIIDGTGASVFGHSGLSKLVLMA